MSTAKKLHPQVYAGAAIFVETAGDPFVFLSFLTQSLGWLRCWYREKGPKTELTSDEPHFMLTCLIDHVAQPWLKGGESVIANIAAGIDDIGDIFGYEPFHDSLGVLFEAYGHEHASGTWSAKHSEEQMIGLLSLVRLGHMIQEEEYRLRQEIDLTQKK